MGVLLPPRVWPADRGRRGDRSYPFLKLPERFVRIRHFGFLTNRARQTKLTRCRQVLACFPVPAPPPPESIPALILRLTGLDIERCALCGHERFCRVELLPPTLARRPRPGAALAS